MAIKLGQLPDSLSGDDSTPVCITALQERIQRLFHETDGFPDPESSLNQQEDGDKIEYDCVALNTILRNLWWDLETAW